MIVNLSGEAELVTLEGECMRGQAEMMGIDNTDSYLFSKGYLTPDEQVYIASKYPELMGIPFLAALAPAVPSIVKGIGSLFGKKKKKSSSGTSAAALQQSQAYQQMQQQLQAMQQQQQTAAAAKAAADKQKQTLMMIGIPAAALILFMMMSKK